MGAGQSDLYKGTYGDQEEHIPKRATFGPSQIALIAELAMRAEKYCEEDMQFITKDISGKIVWLETGTEAAGLNHILARHIEDFQNVFNISAREIPSLIEKTISSLSPVSDIMGKRIYEIAQDIYLAIVVGDNGYIVTSFPILGE